MKTTSQMNYEPKVNITIKQRLRPKIGLKSKMEQLMREIQMSDKSESNPDSTSAESKCDATSDTSSVCYICAKEFSTRSNMLRHVREHFVRRFVCKYEGCHSYFTQKSSLRTHINQHKGTSFFNNKTFSFSLLI